MNKQKYQIAEKSNYLNIFILIDELKSFHKFLSEEVSDIDSWITKLRNTRNVFLSLNNVLDAMNRINLNLSDEYVNQSRSLKKKLAFANHFRNRAVGHLNETLLERAVQWSPQIFSSTSKENNKFKISEAHRVIIEACTNSYVNQEGIQKVFNTEIDLMYPPDAKLFFNYLQELVTESLEWLTISAESILSNIKHHDNDEIQELAAIAAKTNFDLKVESEYNYPQEEQKVQLSKVIQELEKIGTETKVIELIKSQFKS
jgi:signal recognition particle subunit SEC65